MQSHCYSSDLFDTMQVATSPVVPSQPLGAMKQEQINLWYPSSTQFERRKSQDPAQSCPSDIQCLAHPRERQNGSRFHISKEERKSSQPQHPESLNVLNDIQFSGCKKTKTTFIISHISSSNSSCKSNAPTITVTVSPKLTPDPTPHNSSDFDDLIDSFIF